MLHFNSYVFSLIFVSFLHLVYSCSQGDYNYADNNTPALPLATPSEEINDALDYAIENGNWEQVAASAAALVEKEM